MGVVDAALLDSARGGTHAELAASVEELRHGIDELFHRLAERIAEIGEREHRASELRAALDSTREAWERGRHLQQAEIDAEWARVRAERRAFDEERGQMAAPGAHHSDILTLNVGGERCVQRRRSTLCAVEDSFLAARFSGRWEQIDRDSDGRHFVNYSPDLFLPLLDYLSAKETEDAAHPVPLPRGPEHARPQFEEMLRYFGILPGVSTLDAMFMPYSPAAHHDCGFAFEVTAKSREVSLRALEASAAGGSGPEAATAATVYVCVGTLARRLSQHDAWTLAGRGPLWPGRASRIEFPEAMVVPASATCCIYIATDGPGGIAFGSASKGSEVGVENDDLRVNTGKTSGSPKHFAGFGGFISWFHFNGKLEYTLDAHDKR